MKKKLFAGIVLFAVVLMSGAFALAEDGFINIYLSKTKELNPDKAEIVISVETSDKSSQVAADENKKISLNVQKKIKSLINAQNGDYVITSNYSLSPRNEYKNGKTVFDKYVAINTITVYTKSLDKVSLIVDSAIKEGATRISNLNFKVSDYDKACTALLTELVAQSKDRANKLSAPAGTTVKGVKSINTTCSMQGGTSFRKFYSANALGATASADTATPIESGKLILNATVDVSYFLK
ncbi:SIMPL domain-containing protein [bacterium]|nr:SIMPL domain-containing protein [bacterium]